MRKIFLSLLLFLIYFAYPLYSADLDNLYQALLKKNEFLYRGNLYYFELDVEGIHGSSSYDKFDADPYIYSFENLLRFSPASSLDIAFGFNEIFPAPYKRLTYAPSGSLTSIQEYELDYFQDYLINLRMRKKPIEIYVDISEKRQRSNWNWSTYPNPPNYFSYIKAHYEDFTAGGRYLSECVGDSPESNLSKITRPLLCERQINIETAVGYKNGKLRRRTDYNLPSTYNYSFFHRLRPHLTPELMFRYGLHKNLELESGIFYTTPFKYKYEYKLYYPGGSSFYVLGAYKLKHNFYVPFNLCYRARDNLEIMLSSDFHYISQRLDYQRKETNDTMTRYPFKKLTYYNIQPTIKLTYLYDNEKEIERDEFSSLIKTLLRKNQFLLELQCQKDITELSKNPDNGPQNIIDPYNVFLYPLDYFVEGSEYATFFTGNYSQYATNVIPQNYWRFETAFTYGLFDTLNAGVRLGYRGDTSLKHFTLHDLNSRSYRFKPYYFLDFFSNWRLTQNSLLSLKTHFVPDYTTYLEHEAYPKEFKSKNEYFGISLALNILL